MNTRFILAALVLRLAEQDLAFLFAGDGPAQISQHLHAALYRRALGDLVEPDLQMRKVRQHDALVLPAAQPGEGGDVGDGILTATQPGALRQPPIDHAIEAFGLVAVAVDRIFDLLRRIHAKVMRLAQHGPYTAHLEHQPLQNLVLGAVGLWHQLTRLRGQVDQDRARFEQGDRLAVRPLRIGDGRDLVVGAYLQEFRLELVAGPNIDRNGPVRQATLFQHDVDFV